MTIEATKTGLSICEVSKSFGEVKALINTSLEIKPGEFFTLLGPSGCGKTTLMRIIAGLELADTGTVLLSGKDISRLPANKRHVNTVFQSYALFPHLTVFENVAFGLRSRKVHKDEINQRVTEALTMVDLTGMADRLPQQMSGGQQQRVALSRALVNQPEVLLLDEPMSALDAKLRTQVQVELKRLHQRLGQTFILVTHDQDEALVVSDRIAVMNHGEIIQHGTPKEVYERPTCRFVAEFLGAANLISGIRAGNGVETEFGALQVVKEIPWQKGTLAIRPERVSIHDNQPEVNGVKARILDVIYLGSNVELLLDRGFRVRTDTHRLFTQGEEIWLSFPPERLVVLND
ncbi:MAG: ABC transporter ATP-binding protein [Deltaproteobacteria bacterium]|nr:ABC transporter ATP-binding protein [Deltaproteobacteria bacterium]